MLAFSIAKSSYLHMPPPSKIRFLIPAFEFQGVSTIIPARKATTKAPMTAKSTKERSHVLGPLPSSVRDNAVQPLGKRTYCTEK